MRPHVPAVMKASPLDGSLNEKRRKKFSARATVARFVIMI
jgi:hypothetical protein